MSHTRRILVVLALAAAGVAAAAALGGLGGCSPTTDHARPRVIRFGLQPEEDAEEMIRNYRPFMNYLSGRLGLPVEPYVPTDYSALAEAIRSKKVDVAWFGPLAYVLAQKVAPVESFAAGLQDEQGEYRSIIVVRSGSDIHSLDGLRGKDFGFTDPASTSGHLFARYQLLKAGIEPESFFAHVTFTGGHDASLLAVQRGELDAAATSMPKFERLVASGLVGRADYRVIASSEVLPSDPISYRVDLAPDVKQKIREAFLDGTPELRRILSGTGFTGFREVKDSEYDLVRDVARTLGLKLDDQ